MQLTLTDLITKQHFFDLPLDHNNTSSDTIRVFAREVYQPASEHKDLPYLVYFQGGPGFGANRPMGNDGWIKRATQEFKVLLLDQRGTGLSSPINYQSLAHLSPEQQAEHLTFYRADSIIQDAELIRKQLIGDNKWSIIGQSFGGFCVLKYLSDAPQSLNEAYITGGIPSLELPAEDVYKATYQRVQQKNNDFFKRFPDAQQRVNELAKLISEEPVYLATGEQLTVEMLQATGINLGVEQGPETLYYLLEQAIIDDGKTRYINPLFLTHFSTLLDFNTNPIFAILHESIYCQQQASQWAAHRVRAQFDEFNYQVGRDLKFTGEMVYPWFFEQFNNLKPLQQAAEILAQKQDWSMLYDVEQLANNSVPVAAAIYSEDMFVEMKYSLETAAKVNNLTYWLTSEYEHNGIRMDGEHILDKLISLNRGHCLR